MIAAMIAALQNVDRRLSSSIVITFSQYFGHGKFAHMQSDTEVPEVTLLPLEFSRPLRASKEFY